MEKSPCRTGFSPFIDEEEKQSAKWSGCIWGGWLDFLSAATTFSWLFSSISSLWLKAGITSFHPPMKQGKKGQDLLQKVGRVHMPRTCTWSKKNIVKVLFQASLPHWRRSVQCFTGTLDFPSLTRCMGMLNTVVFKMLLLLIGCYLNLVTDLSIPLAFL